MKSPAFQFYPSDFLSDENVAVMSNQEVGCYMKLMCYCWREGSIPSDISKLARLCGEDSSAMAKLWLSIELCFTEDPENTGRLIHPRLEEEREKQESHRQERSDSGLKGAKSRWGNRKQRIAKPSQKNGSAMKEPMANDGSSSSPSSSSSNPPIAPQGACDGQAVLKLEHPKPLINTQEFAAEIFALYPRNDGKAEAMQAITEALKRIPPLELRLKVEAYAKAVSEWDAEDLRFVPWCQKWMRKKRWLDDPSAWVRKKTSTSTFDLKAIIESKESRMKALKKLPFYSDTQTLSAGEYKPPGWRDEAAKAEYIKLREELKPLKLKLEQQAAL